jgi:hypothetical protein
MLADGIEGLLVIPGAAIGTAQPGHDGHCFGEKRSRIGGRVALRAHASNVNDALEEIPSVAGYRGVALQAAEKPSGPKGTGFTGGGKTLWTEGYELRKNSALYQGTTLVVSP